MSIQAKWAEISSFLPWNTMSGHGFSCRGRVHTFKSQGPDTKREQYEPVSPGPARRWRENPEVIMRTKKRYPKKTAMLEVRVAPEDKAEFLSACVASGHSASMIIRKAMRIHARRIHEKPGRQRMIMTMMLMLPLAGVLQVGQPSTATEPVTTERPVCSGGVERRAPIWPVGAAGDGLAVPPEGIRVTLRFDQTAEGRATNIRPDAPEGYDAFVTAAVAALRDWCFPTGTVLPDQGTAFDFKLAPEAG
jgi:hypothetical protein